MSNTTDILQITKDIAIQLWAKYGDVLKGKPRDGDEIRDTYYVSELLKENGHKYITHNGGGKLGRAYYSELAVQDAFTAGKRIGRIETAKIREQVRAEIRQEFRDRLLADLAAIDDWN